MGAFNTPGYRGDIYGGQRGPGTADGSSVSFSPAGSESQEARGPRNGLVRKALAYFGGVHPVDNESKTAGPSAPSTTEQQSPASNYVVEVPAIATQPQDVSSTAELGGQVTPSEPQLPPPTDKVA